MQPRRHLLQNLSQLAIDERCIFTFNALKVILPESSTGAFKTLLGRAVKEGVLSRFGRGLYLFKTRANCKDQARSALIVMMPKIVNVTEPITCRLMVASAQE